MSDPARNPSISQTRLLLWHASPLPDRLAMLTTLIEAWRRESRGEPGPQQLAFPSVVPEPLRWFYRIVFEHGGPRAFHSDYGGWTNAEPVVTFHWLKRPERLAVDEYGVIEFLNENQGVYQCGVRDISRDPAVVTRHDANMKWSPEAVHLTDFLLVLLAFEFSIPGELAASGLFPSRILDDAAGELVRLDFPSMSWLGRERVSTYHSEDLIVLAIPETDGKTYLQAAARSQPAFEALRAFGAWEFGFP